MTKVGKIPDNSGLFLVEGFPKSLLIGFNLIKKKFTFRYILIYNDLLNNKKYSNVKQARYVDIYS